MTLDAIQRDLHRLERWACANLLNKAKCESSTWGNPKCKSRLGGARAESSSEGEVSEVLVAEKRTVSRPWALAGQKATCILGCIQSSVASRVSAGIVSLCSRETPPGAQSSAPGSPAHGCGPVRVSSSRGGLEGDERAGAPLL